MGWALDVSAPVVAPGRILSVAAMAPPRDGLLLAGEVDVVASFKVVYFAEEAQVLGCIGTASGPGDDVVEVHHFRSRHLSDADGATAGIAVPDCGAQMRSDRRSLSGADNRPANLRQHQLPLVNEFAEGDVQRLGLIATIAVRAPANLNCKWAAIGSDFYVSPFVCSFVGFRFGCPVRNPIRIRFGVMMQHDCTPFRSSSTTRRATVDSSPSRQRRVEPLACQQ